MNRQKIIVIGAGPVGALAALYAAKRGHEVALYELRNGKSAKICMTFSLTIPDHVLSYLLSSVQLSLLSLLEATQHRNFQLPALITEFPCSLQRSASDQSNNLFSQSAPSDVSCFRVRFCNSLMVRYCNADIESRFEGSVNDTSEFHKIYQSSPIRKRHQRPQGSRMLTPPGWRSGRDHPYERSNDTRHSCHRRAL